VTDFLQTLVNGLAIGSLYALIALGYTMVYGILKFINFAHSDVFVVGAWTSLVVATAAGWAEPPFWSGGLVIVTAMVACGVLGFVIERLAYKPLRNAPRLNVLITAIGVSLFLQNVGQLPWVFGTQPQRMPALLANRPLATVAGVQLNLLDVVGAGTAVLLMFGLEALIYHTKVGRAMRAVSFNVKNASLMGVNVSGVISFTFVLGSALAAAAGFLYAMKYPVLNQPAFSTWVLLGLKAFVAAVVGGIGNVRGAMLGGFLIGILEQFGVFYISADLKDVYVFSLLIIVLLVRPSGILGSTAVEKV
jgi:branched-chain amino acid transport system permease protein